MSKELRTKFLFQKYLQNNCSKEEMEELFLLLNEEANQSAVADSLNAYWKRIDVANADEPVVAAIFDKIKSKSAEQEVSYGIPKRNFAMFRWVAAACLVIGVSCSLFYFWNGHGLEGAPKTALVSKHILKHALTKIVLADGSTVILKKGSYLNYPNKFGNKSREVYLTGEGYFDIKHDPTRPFLVHAGSLTTKVLGTAFNIKSNPYETKIEVTVTRGKVSVSNLNKTLAVLLPNQQLTYNSKSATYLKQATNAKVAVLWKEEDLVLKDIAMYQAVTLLQERYGVEIVLANEEIKDCKFTAYFLNTSSLEQIIKVITQLNNLNYHQTANGSYVLSGSGCE